MMKLETVLIKYADSFLRINKSDFDPQIHEIYTGEVPDPVIDKPLGIDLNSASVTELKTLPNINVAMAKKIIEGRPYQSVEDLPSEIDKEAIKDKVYFGEFTPVNKP